MSSWTVIFIDVQSLFRTVSWTAGVYLEMVVLPMFSRIHFVNDNGKSSREAKPLTLFLDLVLLNQQDFPHLLFSNVPQRKTFFCWIDFFDWCMSNRNVIFQLAGNSMGLVERPGPPSRAGKHPLFLSLHSQGKNWFKIFEQMTLYFMLIKSKMHLNFICLKLLINCR